MFSLYLSPWYSDLIHVEWCGFVFICWFVSFTKLGYLLVTSQYIDLAAERIIICCDATFLLHLNHHLCFCCIYRHGTLIWSIVNDVASSASAGLLIYHTWINTGYIRRHRSRSREDHDLLWCNFSFETQQPSVFSVYLSPWYSDLIHVEWCGYCLHLMISLIYHTCISVRYIRSHISLSREDHHLLWCNFSSPSEPPSVFLLYLSP
jgi:hypothetical protein